VRGYQATKPAAKARISRNLHPFHFDHCGHVVFAHNVNKVAVLSTQGKAICFRLSKVRTKVPNNSFLLFFKKFIFTYCFT
jgi:hypothetical protein